MLVGVVFVGFNSCYDCGLCLYAMVVSWFIVCCLLVAVVYVGGLD